MLIGLFAACCQGVDLIWESVGGEMVTTCTRALAQNGRLVVIGMMSQYADGWAPSKVYMSFLPHLQGARHMCRVCIWLRLQRASA